MILKNCFFLLFILSCLLISTQAFSNESTHFSPTDSLQKSLSNQATAIDSLDKLGESLMAKGDLNESLKAYKEAQKLAAKVNDLNKVYLFRNRAIETLWRDYQLDEAFNRISVLLKEIDSVALSDRIKGISWGNLATIHLFKGNNDSSKHAFRRAIEFFEQMDEPDFTSLSGAYNNLGALYYQLSDWDLAYKYFSKSLEVDKKVYGEYHEYVTSGLMNMGVILEVQGLIRQAMEHYLAALESLEKSGNEKPAALYMNLLSNMGGSYRRMGQLYKALRYSEQALNYSIKTYGPDHPHSAYYYYTMGVSFQSLQQLDSSEYYYEKAMRHKTALEQYDVSAYIDLLGRYPEILSSRGRLEEGIKVIDEQLALDSDNPYFTNLLFSHKGYTYFISEEYEKAKAVFEELFQQYDPSSQSGVLLTRIYLNYAETLNSLGEYEDALNYIQLCLQENMIDWTSQHPYDNPDSLVANEPNNVVHILGLKAAILSKLYQTNGEIEDLQASLDTYELLDHFIHQLRQSYSGTEDKFLFQRILHNSGYFYSGAVSSYYMAYEATGDRAYLEKCFLMSENSKNTIITSAFNSLDIGRLSAVPEKLLSLEEQQKSKISYYTSELALLSKDKDSSRNILFKSKLFNAYATKDSLIRKIEEEFPSYYQYKYQSNIVELEELQQAMSSEMTMVSYFIGDTSNYAFIIEQDNFEVRDLGDLPDLDSLITEFQQRMKQVDHTTGSFFEVNHRLYQLLFEPLDLDEKERKSLVIVPDEALGYLPFEALITAPGAGNKLKFQSQQYLLRKFNISYSYSANFFINSQGYHSGRDLNFIGFAPSYGDRSSTELDQLGVFRDALVPLKWNKEELQQINQYIPGQTLVDEKATETVFKSHLNRPGIIHLAMHALVDDENPMNSKLAFSQENDEEEDGFLHVFELFNMQLKANMVVLSACETGYGQLKRSEGIISLASGFASAGVPSIVMSHWNVDDKITARLMALFYKNLSDGMKKDEALRQAKLQLMKDSDPAVSNPYFWASFVVVGDTSPLGIGGIPIVFWYLGAALVILMVIFLFLRKPKQKSN